MKARVGLKDIAQEAGVSVVTASLALRDAPDSNTQARVSAARREEIRQIAARMGYRTNAAGRILKSKKISDIGLLFFEETEQIRGHAGFTDLNIQVNRICRRNNIRYQLDWFDPIREPDGIPAILTDGLVGGVLIAGCPFGASERFLAEQINIPFVRIDEEGQYCVLQDYITPLREALAYLNATGHRRVGLINGPKMFRRFRETERVFLEEATRYHWDEPEGRIFTIPPYDDFVKNSILAERAIFERPDFADAVLVASGIQANGILSLIHRRGLKVPEDVSFVSIATEDWETERAIPRLTAVEANHARLAEEAVSMLRELMETGNVRRPRVLIPEKFSIRDSVINRSVSF